MNNRTMNNEQLTSNFGQHHLFHQSQDLKNDASYYGCRSFLRLRVVLLLGLGLGFCAAKK